MRALRKEEIDLICFILKDKPDFARITNDLKNDLVKAMNDGGMGSLKFYPKDDNVRTFGRQIAEINLSDVDGVPLSITINIDNNGDIFELDIWKVDFSPLKQFPIYPYVNEV